MPNDATPAYYPFRIGALECAAVSAGTGSFRVGAFFANAPPDALAAALSRHNIHTEKVDTPFNCLLIRHPDGLLLVDAGTKPGRLTASLQSQGIAAQDVGVVVFSHAHPDHIYGAVDKHGQPVFPRARHIIARPDHEQARARLPGLALDTFEPGDQILDGIRALPAPGHTPGQVAIQICSQGETLLYTSDVIAHSIHLEQPTWNIVSDADAGQAVRTRADLLGQAADAGWWLFVYHFPFPGLCRIAWEETGGWRMVEQPGVTRRRGR